VRIAWDFEKKKIMAQKTKEVEEIGTSKDDFRSIFGHTLRGLKMERRLRLMDLEVGMDLSKI